MRLGKRAAAAMLLALWCLLLAGCEAYQPAGTSDVVSLDELPPYSGEPYVEINGNEPAFLPGEMTANSYEVYSPLDELGRCGEASACVGVDLMPTEERGSIGQVKPTGWQTVKYDCVDGKYLYNRCHLIGYQLSGENANKQNLITGTRYMNTEGMLPFEMEVLDYIRQTGNHVLYRVTPEYTGDNLLADGVQMEAWSVEDDGRGIKFNVYCYNVQPGVVIDYVDGASHAADQTEEEEQYYTEVLDFILNTRSMKFHTMDCPRAADISAQNRDYFRGTRQELLDMGYTPAQECN